MITKRMFFRTWNSVSFSHGYDSNCWKISVLSRSEADSVAMAAIFHVEELGEKRGL
jgi:hypothetical protein